MSIPSSPTALSKQRYAQPPDCQDCKRAHCYAGVARAWRVPGWCEAMSASKIGFIKHGRCVESELVGSGLGRRNRLGP